MISEFPLLRAVLFFSMLFVMYLIESRYPARSWTDSRFARIKFSVLLAIANNVVMRLLVIAPFLFWTNYVNEQGWGLVSLLGLSGFNEIILTIFVFDFFDAIKHLAFHRVSFMWRFHRVHHTDKHLDILTALRYHPGEFMISAVWKAGWLVIWGPSLMAFTIFEIVLNIASQFHHSNIDLGKFEVPLSRFLVTPKYHALHHTIHREKGDLERLGHLQDKHLNFFEVIKSPLISPKTGTYKEEAIKSSSDSQQNLVQFIEDALSQKKAVLVDVRENSELISIAPLPKALHMPFSEFKWNKDLYLRQIKEELGDKKALLYCAVGIRSGKVAAALEKEGLAAQNIGGIEEIRNAQLSRYQEVNLTSETAITAPLN